MNPVLKITTKLSKKEFDKGINEMKRQAKQTSEELNAGGEATEGMTENLKSSVGAMAKLAVIIGTIVLAVKALSDAVTYLLDSNEEMNNKVRAIGEALRNIWDGITQALAGLIKPALEWIVNTVYKLLGYLNAITEAWFGFSIFADNQKKRLKDANKEAKKLKKTLAGFDELNILSDPSTKGGSGASDEPEPITFPEVETPGWLQWIIDNKDLIIGIILGIGAAFALVTGNIPLLLGTLGGALIAFWEPLSQFLGVLGQVLWDYIIVPIGKIIAKIGEILTPVINVAKNIFNTMYKNIKIAIDNTVKIIKAIIDTVKFVYDKVKPWIDKIVKLFTGVWDTLKRTFGGVAQLVVDGFINLFKMAFNALMFGLEKILNAPINAINALIDVINAIPAINLGKLSTFNLPRLAKGGIVNNPGPGVMMGSYIAGERGAEAVIPLTDDTLQRLANMIPINIDLTNRLDSRIISKRKIEIDRAKAIARNGAYNYGS